MKIKIEKLIYEGWGIGHSQEGKAIFVKKSVPGDLLEVSVTKEKKSYSEAVIEKIIEPSEHRVTAPCQYFNLCGGCDHQNISYPDQLKFKENIFLETLERAKIDATILPIIQAGEPFYYRNSIRFFLVEKNDRKLFTRHNYRYTDGLVEAESCLLQSEFSNKILEVITETLNSSEEKLGSLYQVKIREGKATNDYMVELMTDSDELPFESELKENLRKMPEIKSLFHTITYNRKLQNIKRRLLFGSPIIYEKIGKFKFQISADSFFQTNSLGVKTLYDVIKEYTAIKPGENILDLYCGTGTIGIYLSTLAKSVTGIELVQNAINDAKANAKINNVHNCDFVCADAARWLSKNKTEFDKIIIDPPRAGLNRNVIELLSTLNFKLLTYVSCNPATFARDIADLEKCGIKLIKVQPIDMFPQTHHLECVGLLSK